MYTFLRPYKTFHDHQETKVENLSVLQMHINYALICDQQYAHVSCETFTSHGHDCKEYSEILTDYVSTLSPIISSHFVNITVNQNFLEQYHSSAMIPHLWRTIWRTI